MYNTVQSEAVFFLAAVLAGVVTAFLYDIIRISRRIVSINASAVNGEDILFFAIAAGLLFYVAYIKNSGEIGLHGILGGVLGATGYAVLIRNRFVNLGTTFLKWAIKGSVFVLKTAFSPIKIILKAVKKPVSIIAWYTGRSLRRAKRIAKTGKAKVKMRLRAALLMARKK